MRAPGIPEQDRAHARGRCGRPAAARTLSRHSTAATTGIPPCTATGCSCASCGSFPNAAFAPAARAALARSLTRENIAVEVAYLQRAGRASFERPYGLAWLLQLSAELRSWKDPQAQEWARNLAPLESRSRRAHQTLAAGSVLPDSRRRTRSDRVFVRPDLGLGGCRWRCGDAQAARGCGATFLCRRPQLPVELRAFGTGFSFAVPRRSGLHAPRARSRGIRALADNLPAADPEECARRLAARRRS